MPLISEIAARLREPSECLGKIFKTSFVRKSNHLLCESFLSLGHVVGRISREYAAADVSCLRREGFHDTFSLFTSKMPDEISGKARAAKSQT